MDKVDNSANRHIFDHSGAVIGLFAKQPVPGQVKTRLMPPLTAEQACQLYTDLARATDDPMDLQPPPRPRPDRHRPGPSTAQRPLPSRSGHQDPGARSPTPTHAG